MLDISNFAISRTIYPVPCGHLTHDQSKKLSVPLISISRIFAYVEQIFRSFEQFSLVISNCSQNFQNFSCIFFLKLVCFQHMLAQLLQLYRQEWVKTLKSNFFCSFFIKSFDSNFFITKIFNKTSL